MTTRRTVLTGAGAAAAATVLAGPLVEASAAHAESRVASGASRRSSPSLLSAQQRHLVGRFSYGVTPSLAKEVRAHGGAQQWFEWQLRPGRVPDTAGDALRSWYPTMSWSVGRIVRETQAGTIGGWQIMTDYQNWLLMRRMVSRRQVLEIMTEFWENHFNVPVSADGVYTWRRDYGEKIRAHALDSFESLLQAVSVHPAMGLYLGNAVSDAEHPNENQARELLELHTVGLAAGYTEKHVVSSARILTGWQVDVWNTWKAGYNEMAHWTGKVRVLDFHAANSSEDGRQLTRDYLHYLAHHPATAQHIAAKLATVFVGDAPPRSLVDHLAKVYLAHGTQIRPVLQALVGSAAFRGSVGAKIRDPENDLVASYRLMGIKVAEPDADDRAAHQLVWQAQGMGMMPMSWPAPNGQPIVGAAWASPSRVMGSMGTHYSMANGWWPNKGIQYRTPVSWLPTPTTRFDDLVEHLAQRILHRHAGDTLQKACREAVGLSASTLIDKDHALVRWQFGRLLTTFFDSPDFLRR